jgi:hypothetical protein
MERRELLKLMLVLTGGAMIGGDLLISGCKTGSSADNLTITDQDVALLDEVGDTIFPQTTSPGAKETGIGKLMRTMVNDCYEAKDKTLFIEGFKKLNAACEKMHKTDFMKATALQRTSLLEAIDAEAKAYTKSKKAEDPNHYFTMYKQLVIWGYFTSEAGATKALRYLPVPAKYDGSFPYKKGDKAWAT